MIFEFSKVTNIGMWIACPLIIECHLLNQNQFTNMPVIRDQKMTWNSWFLPPNTPLLRIFEISFFFRNVDHVEVKRMPLEKNRNCRTAGRPRWRWLRGILMDICYCTSMDGAASQPLTITLLYHRLILLTVYWSSPIPLPNQQRHL